MSYITKDVRNELFEEYDTPRHIISHCNEVARVATLIGKKLNDVGYSLNIDVLNGAASVHDLVRLRERHDLECAKILKEKGYPIESELVKKHMKYSPFNEVNEIDEQDLLCLSDRIVLEDKYAGLEKRMEYIIRKVKDKKDVVDIILGKKAETKELIDGIEMKIGTTIDELCEK